MDKYEYNVKSDKIKKLYSHKNFEEAAAIADEIDWYKVKDNTMINKVADIYENTKQYEKAKEILLIAYERSPLGRQLAYKLTILAIRTKNFVEADEFYQDFVDMSPSDVSQYLLKYRIAKAKGEHIDVLIKILEAYVEVEMDERWQYELAKLYHEAGRDDECVQMCNELEIWFNEGKYVNKARELKKLITGVMEEYKKRYVSGSDSDMTDAGESAAAKQETGISADSYEITQEAAGAASEESDLERLQKDGYLADDQKKTGRTDLTGMDAVEGDFADEGSGSQEIKEKDHLKHGPRQDGLKEELSEDPDADGLQTEDADTEAVSEQAEGSQSEGVQQPTSKGDALEDSGQDDQELLFEEVADAKSYEKGMLYNLFGGRGGERRKKKGAVSFKENKQIEEKKAGKLNGDEDDEQYEEHSDRAGEAVTEDDSDEYDEAYARKLKEEQDTDRIAKEVAMSLAGQQEGSLQDGEQQEKDPLEVVEDEDYADNEEYDGDEYDEEVEEDEYSPMKSLAESLVYDDRENAIMRAEEALRAAEAAAVEAQRAADIAKRFVEEARIKVNMIKGISTGRTVLGKGTQFEGMTLEEVRKQLDEEERIYERNRRKEERKRAAAEAEEASESKIEIFEFDKSKEGKGKKIGDELTKTAEIDIDEIRINLADSNEIYNTANIQEALAQSMAKLMSETEGEKDETRESAFSPKEEITDDDIDMKSVEEEPAKKLVEESTGEEIPEEEIPEEKVSEKEAPEEEVPEQVESEELSSEEDFVEGENEADDYLEDYDNEPTKRIDRDEINRLLKAGKNLYQTVPLSPLLNQEEDGQIGLLEEKEEETQIDGQMTIEDVLTNLENESRVAAQSKAAAGIIDAIGELGDESENMSFEEAGEEKLQPVEPEETAAEEIETQLSEVTEESVGEEKSQPVEPEEMTVEAVETQLSAPEPETQMLITSSGTEGVAVTEKVSEFMEEANSKESSPGESLDASETDDDHEVIEGALSDFDLAEEVREAMRQSEEEKLAKDNKVADIGDINTAGEILTAESNAAMVTTEETVLQEAATAERIDDEVVAAESAVDEVAVAENVTDEANAAKNVTNEVAVAANVADEVTAAENMFNEAVAAENKTGEGSSQSSIELTAKESEVAETAAVDSRSAEESTDLGDVLEDMDEKPAKEKKPEKKKAEPEDKNSYKMVNYRIPDNYREMFDDFLSTDSMEESIAITLDRLINHFDMDGTSRTNNVVITGSTKCGKTTLGLSIIKAANRGRNRSGRKVAKVKASVFNKRGVALAMTQIIGTDLIIEQAGNLMPNTIVDLMIAMKNYTEEMLIVMEDDKAAIDRMLMNSPELKNMFNNRLDIEEMEINDMVRIAKDYADSQMYEIDEIGELALYAKLDDISGRNPVMSIEDIQEVIDDAISHARKFSIGRLFGKMKKGKGEKGVLSEQDFLD